MITWLLFIALIAYIAHLDARISNLNAQVDELENNLQTFGEIDA